MITVVPFVVYLYYPLPTDGSLVEKQRSRTTFVEERNKLNRKIGHISTTKNTYFLKLKLYQCKVMIKY